MCNEIQKVNFILHSNSAKIGANLISNILAALYDNIPDDKYKKIPIDKLKSHYSDPTKLIPLEYYNIVHPKYELNYITKSSFIHMAQVVVDQFSYPVDGFSLVIIMDKNGWIPIASSKYSQKLSGNIDDDTMWSRQKRIYQNAMTVFNAQPPNTKLVTMKSEAGEDLELYFSKITHKDDMWGYFIIAAPTGHLKSYQRQT